MDVFCTICFAYFTIPIMVHYIICDMSINYTIYVIGIYYIIVEMKLYDLNVIDVIQTK